jgi:uncharacterized damage-inducible protein DinB
MKTHLTSILEKSRDYTVAVAEAMPEDLYQFKPTAEVWTFNELINHIAYGIQWWQDNFIRKVETKWNPPAARTSKKDTVRYLQQCYKELGETLSKIELTDETINGFSATFDHITHHRGQAVLHLRLNGIAAPEYVF